MYSSGNSYILSYIVQKLTGKTCRELVQERVGKEIGLTDFPWMLSPEGVCSGGNGVSLTTGDMLRIGLLYLNKGKWNGKQLIPAQWVEEATRSHIVSDEGDDEIGTDYGFLFWMMPDGMFRADGKYGQYCVVVPRKNAVIAINSMQIENEKKVLRAAVRTVLPLL